MKVVKGFALKVKMVSVIELSSQQESDIHVDMAIILWTQQILNKVVRRALPWACTHGRKDQSEKTKKRKNTDNVQSSSTNVKKQDHGQPTTKI